MAGGMTVVLSIISHCAILPVQGEPAKVIPGSPCMDKYQDQLPELPLEEHFALGFDVSAPAQKGWWWGGRDCPHPRQTLAGVKGQGRGLNLPSPRVQSYPVLLTYWWL